MRKPVQVLALVLSLMVSTHAGIMQNGQPAPPPPPTTNGEMHYPQAPEIALSLVQSLLALF